LTIEGVATFIKSGQCNNIAFLTGAGVSVGAGIPDFRSPGGMYDTLKPELLTASEEDRKIMKEEPTYVVNKQLFMHNQLCYLELRRPFILGLAEGKWKATATHWFINLCHQKGLLRRLYTQNIDGLDYQTDIPHDKMTSVHGTMGKIVCEGCGVEHPLDKFREKVKANIKDIYHTDPNAPVESSLIYCESCDKPLLKPNTVLYGASLPDHFQHCINQDFPNEVDLLIVAGTSLTVSPANTLVYLVAPHTLRVIVNREPVGKTLGIKYGDESTRDIFCSGDCDKVFLELSEKLGWLEELKVYADRMAPQSLALLESFLKKE